jgi:hypothetical protein
METPDRAPTPGTREHFLEVTRLQRWGTIQEYVELCRARGYFTPEFYRKATAHMERIHVRRMLRRTRYRGLEKTHLQHVATAAAINIDRTVAWLGARSRAKSRTSRFAALAPV